eukprot:scaffold88038_cov36-Phaeocystis_antarctica.AAC.2
MRAESRLEPLKPEAEGADDAVGAVPSLLRSRQTVPPLDVPPPDASHEPELALAVDQNGGKFKGPLKLVVNS